MPSQRWRGVKAFARSSSMTDWHSTTPGKRYSGQSYVTERFASRDLTGAPHSRLGRRRVKRTVSSAR
jgi:hypothetical protein